MGRRAPNSWASWVFLLALGLLFPLGASAQEHGHEPGSAELGKVSFPTSCAPSVQSTFERGVAMLHSYWFGNARKTFEEVLRTDPDCAIAYWGIAVDLMGNTLSAAPPPENARAAQAALEKARAIGTTTARERDWLEAVGGYYRDYDRVPVDQRLRAYESAMTAMAQRYPDDLEVQVFHALTLQASASKTDLTYAQQRESAAILEKLYHKHPQHPGVVHFLIHAYDFPSLAEKGLPAARHYARIAPAVPHARHMPSHIYSMLGYWEDSIASNLASLAIRPDYYHAADFITYAQLQLAQDKKAEATIAKSLATASAPDAPVVFANFMARTAMPARFALERGDWQAAAGLPIVESKYPQAHAVTRFARALGMVRSGDLRQADAEVAEIAALSKSLASAGDSYWAARADEQRLAVLAWLGFRRGKNHEASTLMRRAADGEDGSIKHVAMENRLYPLRELLGDLLLEMGRPAEALREYELALKTNPSRFRGLAGAARAAERAGKRKRAAFYYTKLIDLAAKADSERPEIRHAKTYLENGRRTKGN
jgi:tetratricopeptide (TPR) repeat protein